MKTVRKFSVPRLPGIVVWGAVTSLLTLGMLTTALDLLAVPKAETARAVKQNQRFVVNPTTSEVLLGETSPPPVAKPAEPPAAVEPPAAEPTAPEKPLEAATPEPAAAPADATPPVTPEAVKPAPAPLPAAAEKPAPEATSVAAADPVLPKGTPSLRTTPLREALQEQPRTKDSLVSAPAPEITETVDGTQIPKRGAKDITASKLYAHPFKREADQVMISFVVLNTGLDPQSIGLAMALPSEVTVAYSPYTQRDMAYSENVRAIGHEVWTMLPAMGEHYPNDDPGPMGIIGRMPPEETVRRVREVMGAIPGSVGLILPPDENVTAQKETMDAALDEISARGLLLFTTNPSRNTDQITTKPELAALIRRADLVLDPTPNESQIRSKLAGLLDAAKEKGEFVVVLSSRPQSLQILSDWLDETKLEAPFTLAPLSAIYEPKIAPEVKAPEGGGHGGSEKKPKPAAKPKPKPLPQDQYKQPAKDGEKKEGGGH